MSFNLEFSTGGDHFKRRAMTLCIGSARGYGQTPSAVPYNGQLDVSLVTPPQFTQMLHGLWLLLTGRFLSHKGISVWRSNRIEIQNLTTRDSAWTAASVPCTPQGFTSASARKKLLSLFPNP